jgi:Polysaccharide biosynthesis/export protein
MLTSRFAPLSCHAIPARRLPPELRGGLRDALVPIDYRHLRQEKPPEHFIGAGDVLGIYVRDEIENGPVAAAHYPLSEDTHLEMPSVGQPFHVRSDGTVILPDIPPVSVVGQTTSVAAKTIQKAYVDKDVIKPDAGVVTVDLIRPRLLEVIVLREDTGDAVPAVKSRDTQLPAQRGSAHLVKLPAYENDVLHALTATGGLPGRDAVNAVWILRGARSQDICFEEVSEQVKDEGATLDMMRSLAADSPLIRIPLRVPEGEQPVIDPMDVILQEGDIVFTESRDHEFFVTGGLLTGGVFPLPRDHDVDIFGAIAMASGNAIGPAGINASATNFRAGPGNIVPPTRVLIIRMLDDGQQIKIHVDLRIAANNPRERIVIQPRDVVLLKYRPQELLSNIALNIVSLTYIIPNGQ